MSIVTRREYIAADKARRNENSTRGERAGSWENLGGATQMMQDAPEWRLNALESGGPDSVESGTADFIARHWHATRAEREVFFAQDAAWGVA